MPARFDPALIQRGARLKRSPFFEATQRAGCLGYTIYNHMLLPIRYDDFEAEYRKLLADVTLWDVAVERNVEIAGPDGLRFAQLLTPRDLSKCPVGEGRYVVLTEGSRARQRSPGRAARARRRPAAGPGAEIEGPDARSFRGPGVRARLLPFLPGLARHGGGPALRHRADRPLRHPPHRGRHPQ